MLEYNKQILQKVAFNKGLFMKELKKAFTLLNSKDKHKFKKWCIEKYAFDENFLNNLI